MSGAGTAAMKRITMLELRRNAEQVIKSAQRGQRMILTYRGRPVARIEPIVETAPDGDDPFYHIGEVADRAAENASNDEIDRIVYGDDDVR
jgi:prevent-host-death family protein